MDNFRMRPISEAEIDTVVISAGGRRIHDDSDRRAARGADYILGSAIVELKNLEEEGLEKPERQAKLAALFRRYWPTRPVIVLDRDALPKGAQRDYDRILEGPVKTAVRSAKYQLRQSRIEMPAASASILWIVNNGYSALSHNSLLELVAHRARHDSSEIDGVVVSGCYFYSDGFDSYFLWPIDYVPIALNRSFEKYEVLRSAWNELANTVMTALVQEPPTAGATKGPVIDTEFVVDGITYVKPTPPMGDKSSYFIDGRPRKNSGGFTTCPPVATTYADLSLSEWNRFHATHPSAHWLGRSYDEWVRRRADAEQKCRTKPLVPIAITWDEWSRWVETQPNPADDSVHHLANDLFNQRMHVLLKCARERTPSSIVPSRYILVVTEEIGQDRANDVSHIADVLETPSGEQVIDELVSDKRMFHEHALAVGCVEAISRGIDVVMWQKNLRYAWV